MLQTVIGICSMRYEKIAGVLPNDSIDRLWRFPVCRLVRALASIISLASTVLALDMGDKDVVHSSLGMLKARSYSLKRKT